MRGLLIVNIVLCVFVLVVVPGLIVGIPDKPAVYETFAEEQSLSNEEKEQLNGIVDSIIGIQQEKVRPKIVLSQIACGAMLVVNLYLVVRCRNRPVSMI